MRHCLRVAKLLHAPLSRRRVGLIWIAAVCFATSAAGAVALDVAMHVCEPVDGQFAPFRRDARLIQSIDRLQPMMSAGSPAPGFTLPALDGHAVTFANRRRRPVVIAFGSFTCNVFTAHLDDLKRLAGQFGDRADFLFINVGEANHRIPGLEFMLEPYSADPNRASEDHRRRIRRAMAANDFAFQALVDEKGEVEEAYNAFPLRLVAVRPDGKIGFDAGRGMPQPWDLAGLGRYLNGFRAASPNFINL